MLVLCPQLDIICCFHGMSNTSYAHRKVLYCLVPPTYPRDKFRASLTDQKICLTGSERDAIEDVLCDVWIS